MLPDSAEYLQRQLWLWMWKELVVQSPLLPYRVEVVVATPYEACKRNVRVRLLTDLKFDKQTMHSVAWS